MHRAGPLLDICVYEDVLCPWCFVLGSRLSLLKEELGEWAKWRTRPYPLWLKDAAMAEKDVRAALEEVKRAKAEPEGRALSTELWTSVQPPRSSVPALVALEAAKLQGEVKQRDFAKLLQHAALMQGVDVTRPDAALELAAKAGLDMNRFTPAYQSEELKKLVLEEHRLAKGRGVKGVPTLVVNGRWMISGLRDVSEYRELLLTCLKKASEGKRGGSERILH
ncbi:MAG: DsbA family protein [Myxococcaceae bacterium]